MPRPFRLSPQVGVMVAIVLLALAIPIAAVAFAVHGWWESRNAAATQPTPEFRVDGLEKSLETLANDSLGGARLRLEDEPKFRIDVDSEAAAEERKSLLKSSVQTLGGTVVDVSGDPPAASRWLVTLPTDRIESFRQAMQRGQSPEPQNSPDSGTPTALIEVEIVVGEPAA